MLSVCSPTARSRGCIAIGSSTSAATPQFSGGRPGCTNTASGSVRAGPGLTAATKQRTVLARRWWHQARESRRPKRGRRVTPIPLVIFLHPAAFPRTGRADHSALQPSCAPLLVLVALVLTGVIGAIVGITYLLVEVVVWPTDRRFATPEISLTPHQIGEYASAALQLETLADDLDAGTIAADTAAKHLACILDVLSEADPALRGPLEAKADLILATNYTDSEQLRRFLAFIRRHALRGHGL